MEYVLSAERDITSLIRERFPRAQVLPVMGNHDSSPPDFFPPNHTFYSYFLEKSGWEDLIQNAAARSEFAASCGFYSHVLEDGLVAVLLNTNLYYNTNNTGSDPCGQITWLEETLKGMVEVYITKFIIPSAVSFKFAATPSGTKVIVSAHVPPGFFERDPYFGPYMTNLFGDHHFNEAIVSVLDEFGAGKIVAQIYGHTHTDSFRLVGVSFSGKPRDMIH